MTMRRVRNLILGLVLLLYPRAILADVGLPMIAVYLPPAWLALVPIIVIEAGIGILRFQVPRWRAFVSQAIANALSTLVGLPVTWLVLACIEMLCCGRARGLDSPLARIYAVTAQSPWLIPYDRDLSWMIPVSVAVLTVPFFLMSVAVEYGVVRWLVRSLPARTIRSWVVQANLWSYGFLLIMMLGATVAPGAFDWLFSVFRPVSEAVAGVIFLLANLFHRG